MQLSLEQLKQYKLILWDFDGVIKESVSVKTRAYLELFAPFGPQLAAQIRQHHELHGGMSRYQKIPLYLEWAGVPVAPAEVARYCDAFATAVREAVINSSWVPGAHEYLERNHCTQKFVLVTATPKAEIEDILVTLRVRRCFRGVYGAPMEKNAAIASALAQFEVAPPDALMIGDAESDWEAADSTEVDFLLRRTSLNLAFQELYLGPQIDDFVQFLGGET